MLKNRFPRIREWARQRSLTLTVVGLSLAIVLLFVSPYMFYVVGPGESAVLWLRFRGGTVTDRVYGEGLRIIFPWNRLYIYNVRLQENSETFDMLTKDGLQIQVQVSVRYAPILEELGKLHKFIGPEYLRVFLMPEIGAHARQQVARYEPEEFYANQRKEIGDTILAIMNRELPSPYLPRDRRVNYFYIEDVLVRSIVLPEPVASGIERKLVQRHLMLEYDYRIQKERKESERKAIEAQGIRRFQDIVNEGISDRYLKWKGIDATLELARSTNSKIVIIGAGRDGLPIILGPLESSPTQTEITVSPVAPQP